MFTCNTSYNRLGCIVLEIRNSDGNIHSPSTSCPAVVFIKQSNVIREEWYDNGVLHRDGAPAIIIRRPSGVVVAEFYFDRGKLHRTKGPAVVTYATLRGKLAISSSADYIQGNFQKCVTTSCKKHRSNTITRTKSNYTEAEFLSKTSAFLSKVAAYSDTHVSMYCFESSEVVLSVEEALIAVKPDKCICCGITVNHNADCYPYCNKCLSEVIDGIPLRVLKSASVASVEYAYTSNASGHEEHVYSDDGLAALRDNTYGYDTDYDGSYTIYVSTVKEDRSELNPIDAIYKKCA